jgi:hypothetical protein
VTPLDSAIAQGKITRQQAAAKHVELADEDDAQPDGRLPDPEQGDLRGSRSGFQDYPSVAEEAEEHLLEVV